MNLLSRLLGGSESSHDKAFSNDLKRLNEVKAGLGDQAVNYVRTGADATVLSSLSVLCKANELEVCKTYLNDKSPVRARRELFARAEPYDLDLMQRYGEVVSAAASAAVVTVVGTDAAPKTLRVFFTEAFLGLPDNPNSWPRKAKPLYGKGLTVERALDMARRLGGNLVDFFDVVYGRGGPYGGNGGVYPAAAASRPPAARPRPALGPAAAR